MKREEEDDGLAHLQSAFLVGPDDASRWKLCDVPLQREVTFRPSTKTVAAPVVPGNSYDHA